MKLIPLIFAGWGMACYAIGYVVGKVMCGL